MQRFGGPAAFVPAGGHHHHIGPDAWEGAGGMPPAPGTAGLHHLAIPDPPRAALADALLRLNRADIALSGARDHGIEFDRDRPETGWPRDGAGALRSVTGPLDLAAPRSEASGTDC